jgi:hypothetical protein
LTELAGECFAVCNHGLFDKPKDERSAGDWERDPQEGERERRQTSHLQSLNDWQVE